MLLKRWLLRNTSVLKSSSTKLNVLRIAFFFFCVWHLIKQSHEECYAISSTVNPIYRVNKQVLVMRQLEEINVLIFKRVENSSTKSMRHPGDFGIIYLHNPWRHVPLFPLRTKSVHHVAMPLFITRLKPA